jgi:hypothetical protein
MSNAVLSHSRQLKSPAARGAGLPVAVALAVWFALVFLLGAGGVFVAPGEAPPLALLISLTTPITVFLAAFWISDTFREFILTADLRFMTGIQAWRFGGFIFLVLYTLGVLPGYFAWPAGLGDMAIGVTAPWLLVALIRQPSFAASKTFLAWQVFGILDLVVAVGLGALGPRFLAVGASGTSTTAPMTDLPLVLIPAFFVPGFIILHVAALFQARRFAGERRG